MIRLQTLEPRRLLAVIGGPDAFGYQAETWAYEALDLNPAGAGVMVALDSADDDFASIPLGGNTFSFYGTSYSGSGQLFVSDNGVITFGMGDVSFDNSDLTMSPLPRSIAALWDDWRTDMASSGASNDAVLYKFDTANSRLIIEWNAVRSGDPSATSADATFEAILQLNTGASQGSITFNYPDLNVAVPSLDNGASATVGIKDAGAQGNNRLLIARDDASGAYVATGKAVRVSRASFTGSITGVAFKDFNADNARQGAEPGVSGLGVYLDLNDNAVLDAGEPAGTTAGGGAYAFTGLRDGAYVLRQLASTTYVTTNDGQSITIASGNTRTFNFAEEVTVYTGTIAADAYSLVDRAGDSTRLDVYVDDALTYTLQRSFIPSLVFNLDEGNDTLAVDVAGVCPTITFNGGANPADRDSLNLIAGRVRLDSTQYFASLEIGPGAVLDTRSNDLVVNQGDFATLQVLILDGVFSSTGIVSSSSDGRQLLFLFDNALIGSTEWPAGSGHSIAANAIVGKYTYFGDVNLDGSVNDGDYGLIDAGYHTSPSGGIAVLCGDANLDGVVDDSDYGITDANYGLVI